MNFCPKCGGMLMGNGCTKCDYVSEKEIKIESSEKIVNNNPVAVITNDIEMFPIVAAKCPKCNHNEAYFWSSQTRSGDEPATSFFKCTKCKHTRREYK